MTKLSVENIIIKNPKGFFLSNILVEIHLQIQ